MINKPLSLDRVHPQFSSSLRLLVLCLVRPDLFVIYYFLFIFSKNSFLSLAPLTNATPAFSTLSYTRISLNSCLGRLIYHKSTSIARLSKHFEKCFPMLVSFKRLVIVIWTLSILFEPLELVIHFYWKSNQLYWKDERAWNR